VSSPCTPSYVGVTLHDRIGQVAMAKMEELLAQSPEALVGRKVMAAVVMMDSSCGQLTVVSLGTGG